MKLYIDQSKAHAITHGLNLAIKEFKGIIEQYKKSNEDLAPVEAAIKEYTSIIIEINELRGDPLKRQCRRCNGEAEPSTAMRNEITHHVYRDYTKGEQEWTLNRDLIHCLKCTQCGHSWIPANFPPQKTANDE